VDDAGGAETEGQVCEHFQHAAEILGRRWIPQVIRVLLYGPARFGELRERVPGISDTLLSERLKQLEDEGIVLRTVHGGRPVLIEYSLTESGAGLGKAIDALGEWAERFAGAEGARATPGQRRLPVGGRSRSRSLGGPNPNRS
jgi:DNA-binding HxlR family transcriptional regulator